MASNLRLVITSAQEKFQAKAYTHYYESEGVEEDDWKEAFENTWRIIEAYEDLFDL